MFLRSAPRSTYDVFLSYARVDEDIADALQQGLETFARPWWARRAVRVFRDRTALAAGSDLGRDLQARIAASRWFVLVASPEAARSSWVRSEVGFWRALAPPGQTEERLAVVLSAGQINGSPDGIDWEGTNALPPEELHNAFAGTPTWSSLPRRDGKEGGYVAALPEALDQRLRRLRDRLRGRRADRESALLLRDCIESLAAAVRQVPREDIRVLDRRRRRQRQMAGASLLVVVMVLAAAAYQQLQIAQQQTAIAEARELANEASAAAVGDPVLSIQLALTAYQTDPSAQATAAVMQVFERSNHVDQFIEAGPSGTAAGQRTFPGAEAVSMSASSDGRIIAVGGYGGDIRVWDRTNIRTVQRLRGESLGNAGTAFTLSQDGQAIQTVDGVFSVPSGAVIYDEPPDGYVIQEMSGDGRYVGLAKADRTGVAIVDLSDPTRSITSYPVDSTVFGSRAVDAIQQVYSTPVEVWYNEAVRAAAEGLFSPKLADEAAKWVGIVDGELRLHDLGTGGIEQSVALSSLGELAGLSELSISADGSRVVTGNEKGEIYALDGRLQSRELLVQMPAEIRGIQVSRTGDLIAAYDAAGNVTSLRADGRRLRPLPDTLGVFSPSPPDVPHLQPSPDGRLLLIGSSRGVELWSLEEQRKLADVVVEAPADQGIEPVLAFAPDGRRFAVRGNSGVHLMKTSSLHEIGTKPLAALPSAPDTRSAFRELLGDDVHLENREWSTSYDATPRLSRSGQIAATYDELIRTNDGVRTPLVGGSRRGSSSAFGFAAGDTIMVQHSSPSREADTYRNTIDLWHSASGTWLGEWAEPLATDRPGDQTDSLVIASDRTALTVRPNGEIGQWSVSPDVWRDQLCRIIADTPFDVRRLGLSRSEVSPCP